MTIHGSVAPGFEAVGEAFARTVSAPSNPDAQLAVYRRGELVVDLWAGEGMDAESLTGVFSATKGAAFVVAALLVQEHVIELDRPVARYWPEFARHGRDTLTVAELLAHRAGLIGVDGGFTVEELADDRLLAERLAAAPASWPPGQGYGYHAFTIGALVGEVVRRAAGVSLPALYDERVRRPFGLDLHLGLPASQQHRWVDVLPPVDPLPAPPRDSLMSIAFNLHGATPTDLIAFANAPHVRAQGPASSGGSANARGLAGLYAAAAGLLDGRPALLTPETIVTFSALRTPGPDLVTADEDHFGLGFEILRHRYPTLGDTAFGHSGATGTLGLADPEAGLAYGYVRRRFHSPYAPENAVLLAALADASF